MTFHSLATGGADPRESFGQPIAALPDAESSASIEVEVASASSGDERRPAPAASNKGGTPARSDASSDFRSVIDDLTLENRKLKEELRRFQQTDSPSLRMDQILEVKCHGLSASSKRDLESVLRNFAASSKGSSRASVPRGKKHGSWTKSSARSSSSGLRSRATTQTHPSGGAGRRSPAASPLAGPTWRPAEDSAENNLYQSLGCMRSHLVGLSENEKKEVVVRRLEQLFTGKSWGYAQQAPPPLERASTSEDVRMTCSDRPAAPASREARIDPNMRSHDLSDVALSSPVWDNGQRPSGDASDGVGSYNEPPEQRATRPRELDPRRPQSSAQNMDYIRHLGIGMPDAMPFSARDVAPESDGWVHLNLLGSMAQLSMLNVTTAFIRNAVAEKSKKLQLSNDGQQVHWRGGTEGTRFGSLDRDANHDKANAYDDDDENGPRARKRQRMWDANADGVMSPEGDPASPRRKGSSAEKDFHYKPMFVHSHRDGTSSPEPLPETASPPLDDTGSAGAWPRERKASDALFRSDVGSPGATPRRRRSRDGAIYFYAGAPFYTDLSGDRSICGGPQSLSPPPPAYADPPSSPPPYQHVPTGLSDPSVFLLRKDDVAAAVAAADPLAASKEGGKEEEDSGVDVSGWDAGDEHSDGDAPPPALTTLETSGLAGVVPLDHFIVSISTRQRRRVPSSPSSSTSGAPRSRRSAAPAASKARTPPPPPPPPPVVEGPWNRAGVARLVAAAQRRGRTMAAPGRGASSSSSSSASSPVPVVDVEYVGGGKMQQLPPVPPPPPVHILSSDSSGSGSEDEDEDEDEDECFSWGNEKAGQEVVC